MTRNLLIRVAMVCVAGWANAWGASAFASAGTGNTLRTAFEPGNHGFDPAVHATPLSRQLQEAVYDRLLTYDPEARPAKLTPLAARALPTIAADGKTIEFALREGILFSDDAAFGGRPRELLANDVVFSVNRLVRSASRAPVAEMLRERLLENGVEALDRYRVRMRLREPDFDFAYLFAHAETSLLAAEVVGRSEAPDPPNQAPPSFRAVGSGPYMHAESNAETIRLTQRQRAQPHHSMRIASVEIQLVKGEPARWQLLQDGSIDYLDRVGPAASAAALSNGALMPTLAARGLTLHSFPEPEIIYYYLNFRDPLFAGFTVEQRALRRAIIKSFDLSDEIRSIRGGVGAIARSPLPPGVEGHRADAPSTLLYDVAAANKLLDEAGFKRGDDGWRAKPDGSPLVVTFSSEPLDVVRPYADLRRAGLARIGVRMDTRMQSYAENLKSTESCGLAFWGSTWQATIPTAGYFFQLLYGPNIARKLNLACYESKEFDQLFVRARALPPGAARDALYREMIETMERDGVWQIGTNRAALTITSARVAKFGRHPVLQSPWGFMELKRDAS